MIRTVVAAEQRVVLRSVRWQTYVALVEESEHGGGRMTYDQGTLEIMCPSMLHENAGSLLGRMVETFTLLRNIEIRTAASTTFRRDDLRRGFEADESYYIQHAAEVRHRQEIDLTIDPPPDLVIEVDITSSSIDKLNLFASMKIPEIWRYDGESLWLGRLSGNCYEEIFQSLALQGFPVDVARELLRQQFDASETDLIRRFADHVQLTTDN